MIMDTTHLHNVYEKYKIDKSSRSHEDENKFEQIHYNKVPQRPSTQVGKRALAA